MRPPPMQIERTADENGEIEYVAYHPGIVGAEARGRTIPDAILALRNIRQQRQQPRRTS